MNLFVHLTYNYLTVAYCHWYIAFLICTYARLLWVTEACVLLEGKRGDNHGKTRGVIKMQKSWGELMIKRHWKSKGSGSLRGKKSRGQSIKSWKLLGNSKGGI